MIVILVESLISCFLFTNLSVSIGLHEEKK